MGSQRVGYDWVTEQQQQSLMATNHSRSCLRNFRSAPFLPYLLQGGYVTFLIQLTFFFHSLHSILGFPHYLLNDFLKNLSPLRFSLCCKALGIWQWTMSCIHHHSVIQNRFIPSPQFSCAFLPTLGNHWLVFLFYLLHFIILFLSFHSFTAHFLFKKFFLDYSWFTMLC